MSKVSQCLQKFPADSGSDTAVGIFAQVTSPNAKLLQGWPVTSRFQNLFLNGPKIGEENFSH